MSMTFRADRRTLAILTIVLAAAALRLAFFNGLHFADDPDYAGRAYAVYSGQGSLYADNNGFRVGTWMPAALGYALFGVTHAGLVAYPFVMTLVGVWVVYLLGRRLFDARTGLIAAALYAVYPLDVELASRLLPDPLLASFSLIALACLLHADLTNLESDSPRLEGRTWFVASGAALAWCTVVNMSAVAICLFVGLYLITSFVLFARRGAGTTSRRVAIRLWIARTAWFALGFLGVAAIEALFYGLTFGDPLTKFRLTVSHYTSEGREFFSDLWHYPQRMFFLGRNWRLQALDANGRVYGYYFVAALPALVIGFFRGGFKFAVVACWLIVTWLYLQWGTMSASEWTFLHRLDRHLAMLTPPLVLVIAWLIGRFTSRTGRLVVAPLAMLALLVTSWSTIVARHRQLTDDVALMAPVHHMLELTRPRHVYTDTQTIAYQRFLDRYEDRGRRYEPLEATVAYETDRSLAIVLASSQFGTLPSGINASQPPPHWVPFADFPGAPAASGLPARVRIYRLTSQ